MRVGPKLANETWFGDFEHPVTVVVGKNTLFTGKYLLGAGNGIKNPETGHKSWLTLGLCRGCTQKISAGCLLCVRNELFLKENSKRVKDTEDK